MGGGGDPLCCKIESRGVWGAPAPPRVRQEIQQGIPPHSYPLRGRYGQSEGLTERINEPPWWRCLQGAVDVRWVVVVVLRCCVVVVASQGGHFGVIVLRHTASLFCHQ